jgi:hypothetical protein
LTHSLTTLSSVACDLVRLLVLVSRSRRALAAENLFLRKQLVLFLERKLKPHRAHDSTRLIMVILGRMFFWRDALARISHTVSSRGEGEGRRYEAREAQRAEAYLNSTSSTVSERNEVDAALSRAAAERV